MGFLKSESFNVCSKFVEECSEKLKAFGNKTGIKTHMPRYFRRVCDAASKLILATILSSLAAWLLFYLFNAFWLVYQSTPVGGEFVSKFPQKAHFLNCLSEMTGFLFFMVNSLGVLKLCMTISIVFQLLSFSRWFYFSRGVFGKALWGAAVAGFAAYWIRGDLGVDLFAAAYVVLLIPGLCILPYCFDLSETALPELQELLFSPKAKRNRILLWTKLQNIVFRSK